MLLLFGYTQRVELYVGETYEDHVTQNLPRQHHQSTTVTATTTTSATTIDSNSHCIIDGVCVCQLPIMSWDATKQHSVPSSLHTSHV
jgi:hypothetical protein